jgi:hypothetical protein
MRTASAWNVKPTSTDRATICSIAFCVCSCCTSSSVVRCAFLPLGEPLAERTNPPRRQDGEDHGHEPARDQPDGDDASVERPGEDPHQELKGCHPSNQPPDQAELCAFAALSPLFHVKK